MFLFIKCSSYGIVFASLETDINRLSFLVLPVVRADAALKGLMFTLILYMMVFVFRIEVRELGFGITMLGSITHLRGCVYTCTLL